jgi:hypothetical protein
MRVTRVVAVLLLLMGTGCSDTRSCNASGCIDGVAVILKSETGAWSNGAYDVEVDVNDRTLKCHFMLPDQLPGPTSTPSIECDVGLDAYLSQSAECEEAKQGNAASQRCTPIDDQYDLLLIVVGTPKQLPLRVSRDASQIWSEEPSPAYQERDQNGPGCGICRGATVELTFAP